MNETRKQIIEIIGDYMDKTLSEGCLYYRGIGKQDFKDYQIHNDRMLYEEDLYSNFSGLFYGILGHYDITAVLNFIVSGENVMNISRIQYDKEFGNYITVNLKNREQFNIRIKPLHLYSEQEEKDLLELLQKLSN